MKSIYDQETFLSIIGILQPTSAIEVSAYMKIVFKDAGKLPSHDELQQFYMEQEQDGRVIRVNKNPDLFSLTSKGNDYLSRGRRHARDKARLFLLKKARRVRFHVSREDLATELDGDAPPTDTRLTIEGREANKFAPVVPSGQTYWPRFSKQLINETGPSQTSRDTPFLPLLSFANSKQLKLAMGSQEELPSLDYNSIGLMIGISPRLIAQIAFRPNRHYRYFELDKKGGGKRPIESPRTFLKVIQQFLTDYYLNNLPVHESVQSYRNGRSIISNARQHVGKNFVANIDIKNFFGSISQLEIRNLLRNSGYDKTSALVISQLCTKDNFLPQGAPSSPALSNAYLFNFDKKMWSECKAHLISYTRYADDITMSGSNRADISHAIDIARTVLKSEFSLSLNTKKTRIASRNGQQRVTGVVVNQTAHPPRELRKQIRAAFHNASQAGQPEEKTIKKLAGYLSYLNSFDDLKNSAELLRYKHSIITWINELPRNGG